MKIIKFHLANIILLLCSCPGSLSWLAIKFYHV